MMASQVAIGGVLFFEPRQCCNMDRLQHLVLVTGRSRANSRIFERGSLTHINVIPRPRDLLRISSRGGVGIPHVVSLSPPKQRNTNRLGCRPRIAYRQL